MGLEAETKMMLERCSPGPDRGKEEKAGPEEEKGEWL
jgi:hypothetical protein